MELSEPEVALVIEALEEAACYRDTRSRVLYMAVRRQLRRSPQAEPKAEDQDVHRDRAHAYTALAVKLRRARGG